MSSAEAYCRVIGRRVVDSIACRLCGMLLIVLTIYGLCYGGTVLAWIYDYPPARYDVAVLIAFALVFAIFFTIIGGWMFIATCYCFWTNPAYDPATKKWTPPPHRWCLSCYQASVCCGCNCPGVIRGCRICCREMEEEVQSERIKIDGPKYETV